MSCEESPQQQQSQLAVWLCLMCMTESASSSPLSYSAADDMYLTRFR